MAKDGLGWHPNEDDYQTAERCSHPAENTERYGRPYILLLRRLLSSSDMGRHKLWGTGKRDKRERCQTATHPRTLERVHVLAVMLPTQSCSFGIRLAVCVLESAVQTCGAGLNCAKRRPTEQTESTHSQASTAA